MTFSLVPGIDENIIQIYNDKDIELFRKIFIDITLEYCQSISQSKKHYLIPKVTKSGLKSRFLLISFTNSYLVIGTSEVKLGKPPSLF